MTKISSSLGRSIFLFSLTHYKLVSYQALQSLDQKKEWVSSCLPCMPFHRCLFTFQVFRSEEAKVVEAIPYFIHKITFSSLVITPVRFGQSSMAWNLTKINVKFCSWDRGTSGTRINWDKSGWRAALQKGIWEGWLTAGSMGVSSVPWQPRGQTPPWGASDTA